MVTRAMFFFFFNDTATTEIYTLSLHDALPICACQRLLFFFGLGRAMVSRSRTAAVRPSADCDWRATRATRSEEHTSELQSRQYLVCRLLLEKKNKTQTPYSTLSHMMRSRRPAT